MLSLWDVSPLNDSSFSFCCAAPLINTNLYSTETEFHSLSSAIKQTHHPQHAEEKPTRLLRLYTETTAETPVTAQTSVNIHSLYTERREKTDAEICSRSVSICGRIKSVNYISAARGELVIFSSGDLNIFFWDFQKLKIWFKQLQRRMNRRRLK